MKKFILLLFALTFTVNSEAQVLDPSDDGIIPEASKHYRNNRFVPYPHLRQDDMLWSERHWELSTLEKKLISHYTTLSSPCQIARLCGMF